MTVGGGGPGQTHSRNEGGLARGTDNRQKMAIVKDGSGQHAMTHCRTVAAFDGAAQVECRLETGRTHQIRVHMASIGHALLGDAVYGRTPGKLAPLLKDLAFERQALHAATLGFVHPVTQEKLCFESPLPADMVALIGRLNGTGLE